VEDSTDRTIKIRDAKGGNDRIISLPEQTLNLSSNVYNAIHEIDVDKKQRQFEFVDTSC